MKILPVLLSLLTIYTHFPLFGVIVLLQDGKKKSLGGYATEEEAAKAYDRAARELFGPLAVTNFDKDGNRVHPERGARSGGVRLSSQVGDGMYIVAGCVEDFAVGRSQPDKERVLNTLLEFRPERGGYPFPPSCLPRGTPSLVAWRRLLMKRRTWMISLASLQVGHERE